MTAANALSALNAIDAVLRDTAKPWQILFAWAEKRSGISCLKLFFGTVCAVSMFLITNSLCAMVVSDLLGFAYPAYVTTALMVRTVEQLPAGRPADDRGSVSPVHRWFMYWTLYATALTVQQLCGGLLRSIPFYCLINTAFFAWCAAPIEANGAAFVYAVIVRRYFSRER
ncbi:receptor expression-enhancing protein 5-like [Rhopalosiphum maidis]|uniref:receptor expression-enhancing protein 5-like n=1 Tax=Rhopalosiphum maidis TaxID=43146 RepID=UPI000EFF1270|nr:receptor expression-enhancing protein 5-like [Rhopalosiphum maidis]